MTAPRVFVSASWQRVTSASSDSALWSSRTATAVLAATVASSPWPRPSATASNTPSGIGLMRCRSPHTASPGNARLATPQPISGFEMTLSFCIAVQPFFHRNGRPDADFGDDIEIVHQQLRAGQTHTQSAARRVAVLHGFGDILDARAPI